MIAYLIKSVLCSILLIVFYYLFLENEKVHTFKRYYLPVCLVLSFILPLLTLEVAQPEAFIPEQWLEEIAAPQPGSNEIDQLTPGKATVSEFSWYGLLTLLYIFVSAVLLFRFSANLLTLLFKIRKQTKIPYGSACIILENKISVPFTFWKYIFLNPADFKNPQVVMHELTHVGQNHTLDILLIEFIRCFTWFNPALPFYKKAIQLNHEFIADQKVINRYPLTEYQQMLLSKSPLERIPLTSSLSYSITKKRFVMMNASKNQLRAMIKIALSLITLCCAAAIFPERIYSQPSLQQGVIIQDTSVVKPDSLEFDILVEGLKKTGLKKNGQRYSYYDFSTLSVEKRRKMIELYELLTEEQKSVNHRKLYSVFLYPPSPPIKQSPTYEQLAAWTDQKTYGVWLDSKRISNDDVKKLKPSDLSFFVTSKLLKNAAHYGQYKYQVDLFTTAYYDKNYPSKSR